MIRVTIYKTARHEYVGFDLSGHAGYAESGQDIVCAAVNSLERFTDDETSCTANEETGDIELRFAGSPSHDAALLLDSMILGLEEIEDSREYKSYIDIIFKEV